jgi:uncharacterized protein YukE
VPDFDFIIDIPVFKQAMTNMKKAVKELEEVWQAVENVKTKIPGSWVGESAEAYKEKLAQQKIEFNNRTGEVRDLISDIEHIIREAEKMNRLALSFAGYITNYNLTRSDTENAVVSINKASIKRAIRTCADLDSHFNRQLNHVKDAAFTAKGLKYARIFSYGEFDAIERSIKDNSQRIYRLKCALVQYYNGMCMLEEEVCSRFSGVYKRPDS